MYLGLDLGTSGLKGLVIDDTGTAVAEATASLTVSRPESGWSEQDPAHWIIAAEAVFDALSQRTDLSAVRGIGLSGQMHGATVLDAGDRPLRPCILWNDTRAYREAAEMDAHPVWRKITGNIVFPGFTAPKLEWLRSHEPEVFRRAAKVLLPKDYLRLWLTGDYVSDMSDAAGTSWLDTGLRRWSEGLLDRTHLGLDHMPRLVEGTEVSGQLRTDVAARWGFADGIPVAGGAGDNAASAIGMGVVSAGKGFVSLGTSGVLFAATDSYSPAPETAVHTFCHALPGRWHQMGVILSATDALNWYAGILGHTAQDLTADLGELRAPGGTVFLPYLGGERTPLNDPAVRGAFMGLDHASDRNAMTRAVLEGVAFALRDCRDAMAATGTHLETCVATGGGSRSDYWLQVLAAALELPIRIIRNGELGAALGAARLGAIAATGNMSFLSEGETLRSVEPTKGLADAFAEGHARYRAARDLSTAFARC